MIGRLLCKLLGHKRGRRCLSPLHDQLDPVEREQLYARYKFFQCRRCRAKWMRPIKAKNKGKP